MIPWFSMIVNVPIGHEEVGNYSVMRLGVWPVAQLSVELLFGSGSVTDKYY